ncbi:MAG: hypothetical protein IKK26_04580 [Clostridia bacterium]|nr:hypothetical protein [Clostridia bacterium]
MLGGVPLTVKAFAVALANSLIVKGIDKETAVKNVLKITRSLSEDDFKEIASYNGPEDFVPLTEALTKLIDDEKRAEIIREVSAQPVVVTDSSSDTKPIDTQRSVNTGNDPMAETKNISTIPPQAKKVSADAMAETKQMNAIGSAGAKKANASMAETKQINAIHTSDSKKVDPNSMAETKPITAVNTSNFQKVRRDTMAETRQANTIPATNVRKNPVADNSSNNAPQTDFAPPHYTEYKKIKLTSRGAKFYWTIMTLTSPLIALAFIVYFGILALCMVSVAALIVGCFIVLCGIVIAASLACLVSLIYGVTQMFVSLGIGLYEIGVGVVVCGLAMVTSVLVYLLATRVLPYLLRQLMAFNRHTLGQLPTIMNRAREECNRL